MATNELFDGSELALASYSQLNIGLTNTSENITALQQDGEGMTQIQAEQFAQRWPEVVAQYTLPSGLSFTIFRNGSEVNVAIRGTQTADFVNLFTDLFADLVLGIGQTPAQYNELKSLYEGVKSSGVVSPVFCCQFFNKFLISSSFF